MRVIGIDPGLTRTGYGVVEVRGGISKMLAVGTIRAEAGEPVERSLFRICVTLERVMEEHEPEAMAVERLFVNKNTSTALKVGQASGVALLAAAEIGIPVRQYTPSEVKSAITGVGNADKDQVAFMVKAMLRIEHELDSADAADALALALTHAHASKFSEKIKEAEAR
ncbi:MAG: crossover junction endodeoxyribonuclease RuvC [Actinomycetota bacterium]